MDSFYTFLIGKVRDTVLNQARDKIRLSK